MFSIIFPRNQNSRVCVCVLQIMCHQKGNGQKIYGSYIYVATAIGPQSGWAGLAKPRQRQRHFSCNNICCANAVLIYVPSGRRHQADKGDLGRWDSGGTGKDVPRGQAFNGHFEDLWTGEGTYFVAKFNVSRWSYCDILRGRVTSFMGLCWLMFHEYRISEVELAFCWRFVIVVLFSCNWKNVMTYFWTSQWHLSKVNSDQVKHANPTNRFCSLSTTWFVKVARAATADGRLSIAEPIRDF